MHVSCMLLSIFPGLRLHHLVHSTFTLSCFFHESFILYHGMLARIDVAAADEQLARP